jgi:hypothetical protein
MIRVSIEKRAIEGTSIAYWIRKQSINDCGDNLYSSAIFGAWGTLLVSVCWATTTIGEVGTMRWKIHHRS